MELTNERIFDLRMRAARKWVLVLFAIVVILGLPAVWFGPGIYSRWQEDRLFRRAQEHLKNNEIPGAAINLRRVLVLSPNHLEAARKMAELAEAYMPAEAPALRERVCQIAPDSRADATAWALAALKFGQIDQAEEAFGLMKKLGSPTAEYHEIGARIALAAGKGLEAREGFARASELDPANEEIQFEIAKIDIRAADTAGQEKARETLERLRANSKLRPAVLRTLIGDRVSRTRISEAGVLARELLKEPEATFQDRLQLLDILRSQEHPGFAFSNSPSENASLQLGMIDSAPADSFATYLSELQAEARDDLARVAALISFLNARGMALLATEWASSLPKELVSAPPVAPLLADSYRLALDWPRLEKFITDANWGYLEFMRCAFLARVLRESGDQAGASAQWAAAVKLADFRQERLVELVRMAGAWGWENEREEVLWICARTLKRPREALEELAIIARKQRDSQKLLAVWTRLLEVEPKDVTVQKNWARLAHLLGDDRFRAGTIAQQLYKEHPADPEIAATYAMILQHRRQDAEALAAMSRLSPEQLQMPTIAGYYGMVLGANQRKEEAVQFLARAAEVPLLQEEITLMDQTRRSLGVNTLRR